MCDTVVHENEGHYPELRERQDYITKVIRVEEENFAKTIDGGLKIFHDMLEEHKSKGEKTFSGADALQSVTESRLYVFAHPILCNMFLCPGQRSFSYIGRDRTRNLMIQHKVYRQISMITSHIYQPVSLRHHVCNSFEASGQLYMIPCH